MNEDVFSRSKMIAERLKKEYKAKQVILFGSYARGEETKDSDLDLLIIAPSREKFYRRMAQVRRLIRDLRNGLPVAPIVLNKKELNKRIKVGDQFIEEILASGIRL